MIVEVSQQRLEAAERAIRGPEQDDPPPCASDRRARLVKATRSARPGGADEVDGSPGAEGLHDDGHRRASAEPRERRAERRIRRVAGERREHVGRGARASVGMLGEQAIDQRGHSVGDRGGPATERNRIAREAGEEQLARVPRVVRELPRQSLVEHHAGRVEIGARPHRRAADLLGREVRRRAEDLSLAGGPLTERRSRRDAEVEEDGAPARDDEHVLRLEITVNDAGSVHAGEGLEERDRDGRDLAHGLGGRAPGKGTPSTRSMTTKGRPSASPSSRSRTTPGTRSRRSAAISRRTRARSPAAASKSFTATEQSAMTSSAAHTSPCAPRPSRARSR